jgi:hypothetical protein
MQAGQVENPEPYSYGVPVVAEEVQAAYGGEHLAVCADRRPVPAAFLGQHAPGLTLATARSTAARMALSSLLNAA